MLDAGVNVRFTTLASAPPPFARQLSQLPDLVDRFNYYSWTIPGNYFAQDSVIAPQGEGYQSSSDLTMKLHTFIALTPETRAHLTLLLVHGTQRIHQCRAGRDAPADGSSGSGVRRRPRHHRGATAFHLAI